MLWCVGKAKIINRDFIEYHNLGQQALFDEDHVKNQLPKAIAGEQHLKKVNSSIDRGNNCVERGLGLAKRTHCPFTHNLCSECALYRGRHHYLTFIQQDQGYTDEPGEHDSVDFKALKELVEPWTSKGMQGKNELKIGLKVTDMESGATRICEFNEAKTWDLSNSTILRLIDGRQANSLDH